MRAYRVIHIAANIIAVGLLAGALVWFITEYGGLPDRIGVHFSPMDGKFDLFAEKLFGFYPYIAGSVLIGIFSLLTLAVRKLKKLGLRLTDEGENVLRCAAVLLLDLMKLIWSAFFTCWTYCVINQTAMGDGSFLGFFRIIFLLVLISVPFLFSRIQTKYRACTDDIRSDDTVVVRPKKFRIMHIIANVIAAGMLGVMLIWFLIAYSGLPDHIGVHFGHGLELDVFADKILGLYPFVMGGALFAIFSLLGMAAGRIKRVGVRVDAKGDMLIREMISEALDMMKLIWSVYFSGWAYCVIHQIPMNETFVLLLSTLFLALFPVTGAAVFIISRIHRIRPDNDKKETDT